MQSFLLVLVSFLFHVAFAASDHSKWHLKRQVNYTETGEQMAPDEKLEVQQTQIKAAIPCKVTPDDPQWPSDQDWEALNRSIYGGLIKSVPVASSCWEGNPFNSKVPCDEVKEKWTSSYFHESNPESVGFPIWANNSCVPPGSVGYNIERGCTYGGYPRYVVDAWSEEQIATALKWAASKNIRVVIKGTGHDLYGRYGSLPLIIL